MFCKASVQLRAAFMSSGQGYGSRRLATVLGQQQPAGRALQGAPPDATGPPEASLEVQIRTHKLPYPTVQPGSAESAINLLPSFYKRAMAEKELIVVSENT